MAKEFLKDELNIIEKIAKKHFHIQTMESRNRDSLDFYSVSIISIKKALEEAYRAGSKQTDPLRCAYDDCIEQHPVVKEETGEEIERTTCPTCRMVRGLEPLEEEKL